MMIEQPSLSIAGAIPIHAKFRSARTAFVCGDRRVTWAEFGKRVNRVANALLEAGLTKGDKVSLLSPASIEALEVAFGALLAGGVIVPVSALLTPEMIGRVLKSSDTRFLFVGHPYQSLAGSLLAKLDTIPKECRFAIGFDSESWTDFKAFVEPASDEVPNIRLEDDDECLICYSSGTTGEPKGMVFSHKVRAVFALAGSIELRIQSDAVNLITTPLASNATWFQFLGGVVAGCRTVLLLDFIPEECLKTMEREQVTNVLMVPTQYRVLLDHPQFDSYDLSSLRITVSIGSTLPMDLKKRILDKFGPGLIEVYGWSEGPGTTLKPEDILDKASSVGTPMITTDIRIIDDEGNELEWGKIGEIVGYTPGMMTEYYGRPDVTECIIWRDEYGRTFVRSGDVGKFDEDGFLYILDRKKDMIVTGGFNVFASDIEEVLHQHPDVLDAAVIAIPHEKWIETPLALVRVKPGADSSEDDLTLWVNERVAKHQRLSKVEFREEDFPRNALGKVLKRHLREPYWPKTT
jgi:acyl-CoA synthetase (AMP-forming)/AMP-acid ligase II